MIADARVETDTLDDLLGIKSVGGRIGIEFVEVGHAHCEKGIGEKLDRLCLGRVSKQGGDVFLDRAFLEQICEGLGAL